MSQPATDHAVHLWYTRCGAATASALAIQKQWLQAEFAGKDTVLHSLRDAEDLELRNSHYHHKQSGMFREGGNIPPIWAKGQGQDTVVIGITWLDEYQGILTRADSNIFKLADLQGKRLAIPQHAGALIDFQRGAARHGFTSALKLAALNNDDAHWVDIAAPAYDSQAGLPGRHGQNSKRRHAELEALNRGEVDAIFVRFARGYRLSTQPEYRQLINLNDHPDRLIRVNNGTPRPITVDRAFLERHQDIVVRYLAVLLRTARWAEQHPDEVIRLLASESSDASDAEVLASHGPEVHRAFTPKLSADYVLGLETQKNFLRDWGYLQHDFAIEDWIVREPLQLAEQLLLTQAELPEISEPLAA